MRAKIAVALGAVSSLALGLISVAHADSLFTVPTSTATTFSASVSDTLSDPGLLTIVGVVIALPVVFWLIHRIKGLFPKTSAR